MNIREFLVKLADQLDRADQANFADQIDQALQKTNISPEEMEMEIPEDEKLMLEDVLRALQESLQ